MARRSRYTEYNEDLNVWQAFTDLMSNAFMILVLFLFLTIIISKIKPTDTPPIIVIKDQGDYRFASGSAEIPPKMSIYILKQIVPEIEARTKQYGINVVEIIGHTDGQANSKIISNLDVNLENVASGNLQVGKLQAGSNADLGLMRALSVVKVLGDIQKKQGKLSGLSFRAYSAAQLILPSGQFAGIARKEDVTRRRIEIRFTRLGEVQEVR
ncbi:MAG: flagellar motor protein [Nostocales cyanobacterium ELA583]|jgi:flagellar motor protein MotB